MKTFLIAASCLSLLAPAMAAAQNDQNGKQQHPQQKPAGNQQGGGGNRPGGGQPGYTPAPKPAPNYGGANRPGNPSGGGQPGYKPAPNYGGANRPGNPGAGRNYRPAPNYTGQYRGQPNYGPNYHGNYAGRGRYGVWNGQRFRGGSWNWPRGYSYQRWWIGGILPGLFLAQSYWFDDYGQLGLDAPPYGFEWVRYGPDLLLVNINTGQIVDVEYGVFY